MVSFILPLPETRRCFLFLHCGNLMWLWEAYLMKVLGPSKTVGPKSILIFTWMYTLLLAICQTYYLSISISLWLQQLPLLRNWSQLWFSIFIFLSRFGVIVVLRTKFFEGSKKWLIFRVFFFNTFSYCNMEVMTSSFLRIRVETGSPQHPFYDKSFQKNRNKKGDFLNLIKSTTETYN